MHASLEIVRWQRRRIFEALIQEVTAEEHCRGRKGGTSNRQNHLRVLKTYVTCCCFSSAFEWELSAAQELSGFVFGQHIPQFECDKAQKLKLT